MKKFITVCLISLLMVSMAFAAKPNELDPSLDYKLEALTRYDMPLTPRAKGMGGAGLAMPGRADSFFMNPAGFASRVGVMLPSLDVTLYHPYDLLKSDGPTSPSIVDSLLEITPDDPESAAMAVPKILGMIKNGRGKLIDVNAATSFNILGFAFGLNINDSLHTFGKGSGNLDSFLFDELNVTTNVGFAWRFHFGDSLWLDAGMNWRPTYKAYSTAIGADSVQNALKKPEEGETVNPADFFLEKVPVAAGIALPFDVGVNFSGSWFSVGLVGRNICGTYNMKTFENINTFYPDWGSALDGGDFKIQTPWSLDFGFGFTWDNAFFKPTFVCDIVDINSMFGVEDFDGREFMKHLKAGAEIRLLSCLDIRGGLNQGYWTVGAGLDLAIIKVDLAYYWSEFAEKLGDYGLDALSVRINIGFDR